METGQVDPRLGHLSRQPGHEVQRLDDDVPTAVAVAMMPAAGLAVVALTANC